MILGHSLIGSFGFGLCHNLASITLPPYLTSVGYGTFSRCYGITSINIPQHVTSIDFYAFTLTNITEIVIPASVTKINRDAFLNCSKLKTVLYEGLKNLQSGAFSGCSSLEHVCVPPEYTHSDFCGVPISSCPAGNQSNCCYIPFCCPGSAEYIKRENATEWENNSTRCVLNECDNETGPVSHRLCSFDGSEVKTVSFTVILLMILTVSNLLPFIN